MIEEAYVSLSIGLTDFLNGMLWANARSISAKHHSCEGYFWVCR